MAIYFIQTENGAAIKIGRSDNPRYRLFELQTAHYEELKLLLVINGDCDEENELHKKFAHLHIRGEWYKNDPEIITYLKTLSLEGGYKNSFSYDVDTDELNVMNAFGYKRKSKITSDDLCQYLFSKLGYHKSEFGRIQTAIERLVIRGNLRIDKVGGDNIFTIMEHPLDRPPIASDNYL